MMLRSYENRRKIKNERSVLHIFLLRNEEETRIRCLIWMAAMTLIGHDFKPGFGLSFAAFQTEFCHIAA